MTIVIIGKTGCGKCEAAKEKIALLGLTCDYVAIDHATEWKNQNAHEALAAAAFAGLDFGHPPILVIDGQAYRYAAAMKVLKKRNA